MSKRLLAVLLVLSAALSAFPADFLRTPAPSPDGTKVAFSARGNLWVADLNGGMAAALTTHPGYDWMPVWSPDGKRIAFSSDRNGNDDVFVMNADGTGLVQLTFDTAADTVCDFSPDGGAVLFASRRDGSWMRHPFLYEVPASGGQPRALFPDFGYFGAYAPDGTTVAYTPRVTYYYTKGYDGTGNMRINLYDRKTGAHREVVGGRRDSAHAMWGPDGKGFWYITDRDRVSNLWYHDLASGAELQKTFLTDGDIAYPRIARNGSVIAFENGGGISLYDTRAGTLRPLSVTLPADRGSNAVQYKTFTGKAGEFALGDEEKQVAFTVAGTLFVQRLLDETTARRLTRAAAKHEDLVFTKDEKALYFVSNASGSRDILKMESDDPAEPRLAYSLTTKTTPVAATPAEEHSPRLSPDGKKMLYVRGKGDLVVEDLEKPGARILVGGWNVKSFDWSPDGAWIAFSREDDDFNEDIFLVNAGGGDPVNITRHPAYDTRPLFSPDGKYLAFLSNRSGYQYDVHYVWLTKAEEAKTEEQRLDEEERKKSAKKDEPKADDKAKEKDKTKGKAKDAEKPKDAVEVKVDLDRLWTRVRRLTELPGDESALAVSRDSKKIAFVSAHEGKKDLYCIDRTGENLKRLTTGGTEPSNLLFGKDDAWVWFLTKDGAIQKAKPDGGKTESVKFSAPLALDEPAIREAVFREGWAVHKENFYDPKFHGVDWDAMLERYLPLAHATVTRRDFDAVMNMMLGELNASHLGIYAPADGSKPPASGHLGIRLDAAHAGPGAKVAGVVPRSPADDPIDPLRAGDLILAVDGVPVGPAPLEALLVNTVGRPVVLTVSRDRREKLLRFRPVGASALRDLLYDEYVAAMRAFVDKVSRGRLAYVHIRSMDQGSYDRFQMELFSESHGKDGLIVDVRGNGGGWTTDLLLQLLSQRPHAVTVPRDGGKGYPDFERKRVYTWKKPFVVLCDQDSFSNAEIFSHAVKTLGLAKLVGVETNGSVISTDEVQLLDGSDFRMPTRGWWALGTGKNMEEAGAVPDVVVENPPGAWALEGRDFQVEAAVKVLLEGAGQ
jgi:tricorn protease